MILLKLMVLSHSDFILKKSRGGCGTHLKLTSSEIQSAIHGHFQFLNTFNECNHIYWIVGIQQILDTLRAFFISNVEPLRHIFFLLDDFMEKGIDVTAYTYNDEEINNIMMNILLLG